MVGLFVAIGRMKSKFKLCHFFRVKVVTKESPMLSKCNPSATIQSSLDSTRLLFVGLFAQRCTVRICRYAVTVPFSEVFIRRLSGTITFFCGNCQWQRAQTQTHTHLSLAHAPHRPIKIETVETYYSPALQSLSVSSFSI
jgi:hypothetical protein